MFRPPAQIYDVKKVQLGDILFFKNHHSLSNHVIQTIQKLGSKKDSEMVHVAICLDKTDEGIPIIGHLMPTGFRIEPITEKNQRNGIKDQSFHLFRLAEIVEFDRYRCAVVETMEKFKRQHVQYSKVGVLFSLLPHPHHLTQHLHLTSIKKGTCSTVIAECLSKAKVPGFEGCDPNILPKKLYKACKNNNLFMEFAYLAPFANQKIKKDTQLQVRTNCLQPVRRG